MIKDLEAAFEKHSDEYLKFDRVENKLSRRPDLHAFLLLDKLFPSDSDVVAGAAHDEIFLHPSEKELRKGLTEELVIELTRCGVRMSEYGGLSMFT